MAKIMAILSLFLLFGCNNAPLYKTPEEQIAQKCAEAGYTDDEFNECNKIALDVYKKALAKEEKRIAKARETLQKAQLKEDGDKCSSYGLKKGTGAFASCLMQVEQARTVAATDEYNRAVQRQAISQQIEYARNAETWRNVQNNFVMQPIYNQRRTYNNRGGSINCRTYRSGNEINTDCNQRSGMQMQDTNVGANTRTVLDYMGGR